MTELRVFDMQRHVRRRLGHLIYVSMAAILALIIFVLPAERGYDLTGLGNMLGLTKLAGQTTTEPSSSGGASVVPDGKLRYDRIEILIDDLGELEYKATLAAGAGMVYSWSVEGGASNGGVYFDFHGHPPIQTDGPLPDDFAQSYAVGEAPTHAGALVAPFDGSHGWYFLNLEEGPRKIVLEMSGFYSDHSEVYRAVQGRASE